jgi:TBC1 domain family member 2A
MFSCVRCASARGENASEGDVRGVSSPSSSFSSMGETKDEYGFTISPSARHAGEPRMMTSASMSASDARFWARVREDTSVLREGGCWAKRAIRRGVPRDLRRDVWFECSGAKEMRENAPSVSYYQNLLLMKVDEKVTDQIELDLARTFPENENYERGNGATGEGGNDVLRRILFAYARHNRTTGYCQGMNYIAAFIWIVMGDEERAFWTFTALLDELLPSDVHASDIKGTISQYKILHKILDTQAPKIAKHLRAVDVDLVMIASKWLLCLFVESLPASTTARVLDCVLAEGEKVWFRVVIAMLKLYEREILACDNMPDVMVALKELYRHQTDADELLNAAFSLQLSKATIRGHRAAVQRDMVEEAERKAAARAAALSAISNRDAKKR